MQVKFERMDFLTNMMMKFHRKIGISQSVTAISFLTKSDKGRANARGKGGKLNA